jgi:glucokinase
MDVVIGVDIGGSHVGICFVSLIKQETLVHYFSEFNSSITSPEELINVVCDKVELTKKNYDFIIRAFGVGCPGRSKDGILLAASNFPSWKNVPLVQMIKSKIADVPTILLNDADAAIAAELWGDKDNIYRGVSHAAMLSTNFNITVFKTLIFQLALGTGIGMGLILENKLYSGYHGLVEGGHMVSTALIYT